MEKCIRFDNGLRLVLRSVKGVNSICCAVMVNVGSSLESAENNGYSHLIEHMMFKGTAKRTALQISQAIDNIGGQINAYTSKDMTCYFTRTASEYIENSIELLSDIFYNSVYDEKELEREKKVVLEEILMCEDTPDDVCHDLVAGIFYNNKALGQSVLGPKNNIMSATRDKLFEFIDNYYTANNMCVSIVGNIDINRVTQLVNKYFVPKARPNKQINKLAALSTYSSYKSVDKDIEQAHICIAFKGVPFNSRYAYPLSVLSNIVGGSMSSRLFQVIREQNALAYTVYSYPSYYINNGILEIYLGTNPNNVELAVKLLKKEIESLINDGFTAEEFNRAKAQLKGGLVLSQENMTNLASAYGSYLLKTDKLYKLADRLKKLDATTMEQTQQVLKKVFDLNKMSVAFVGKRQPINLLKLLKSNPI